MAGNSSAANKAANKAAEQQDQPPVETGEQSESVTGAIQDTNDTIPGPVALTSAAAQVTKSPNAKYHAKVAKQHGEHVVDVPGNKPILYEGNMYGPGLVRCPEHTRLDKNGKEKPIAEHIRDIIDTYYSEQPEETEAPVIPGPNNPLRAFQNQFTVDGGVRVLDRGKVDEE